VLPLILDCSTPPDAGVRIPDRPASRPDVAKQTARETVSAQSTQYVARIVTSNHSRADSDCRAPYTGRADFRHLHAPAKSRVPISAMAFKRQASIRSPFEPSSRSMRSSASPKCREISSVHVARVPSETALLCRRPTQTPNAAMPLQRRYVRTQSRDLRAAPVRWKMFDCARLSTSAP